MSSSFSEKSKQLASKATSSLVEDAARERDKSFSRTSGPLKKKDDPIDDIVRAAAAGIGFVSEALHHRRGKKQSAPTTEESQPSSQQAEDDDNSKKLNEVIWALDEEERNEATTEERTESKKDSKDFATSFLDRHPQKPSDDTESLPKLAMPVVLPQRRPKSRTRGFVRAYAPVLADTGIDQDTFLDFVETFNKSLVPNQYIYAFNLAGFADIIYPEPFMMAVGYAIEIAVDAAMEAQSRFRSNKFLDVVNAEFFIPRGLICLVATYQPEVDNDEVAINTEGSTIATGPNAQFMQGISKAIAPKPLPADGMAKFQARMQERMKSSHGNFAFPEPAPLIFPSLEELAEREHRHGNGKKKKAVDRAEQWLDEYMDRRSQASWVEENPDLPTASSLPRLEFQSRYADPNHPASSGDLVALVTGGRWRYGQEKAEVNVTDDGGSDSKAAAKDGSKEAKDEDAEAEKKAMKKAKRKAEKEEEEAKRMAKKQAEKEKEEAKRREKKEKEEAKKLAKKEREEAKRKEKEEAKKAEARSKGKSTDEVEDEAENQSENRSESRPEGSFNNKTCGENQEPERASISDTKPMVEPEEVLEKKSEDRSEDEPPATLKEDTRQKGENKPEDKREEEPKAKSKEESKKEKKQAGMFTNLFQKDVLYLMVVNIPEQRQEPAQGANEHSEE